MSQFGHEIRVYTDGAASGNPGPAGWGAVICLDLESDDPRIVELGGGEASATNNRMEILAAVEAMKWILEKDVGRKVAIYTDSKYLIRGATQWVKLWPSKGWVTSEGKPVSNRDLWEELSDLVDQFQGGLHWEHVEGHQGVPGNERADFIAASHSKGKRVTLFEGLLSKYSLDFNQLNKTEAPKKISPYYLSVVGNQIARHSSWSECEARVKGASGARFKKITRAGEEDEVLQKWGIKNR